MFRTEEENYAFSAQSKRKIWHRDSTGRNRLTTKITNWNKSLTGGDTQKVRFVRAVVSPSKELEHVHQPDESPVGSNVSVDVDSAQRDIRETTKPWKIPTQAWKKDAFSA
jgi:hypothetical protein